MLVLSRRPNEKIVFPHLGITVEILHVKGNSVRVGVDAPTSIKVYRHEVAEQLAATPETPPSPPLPPPTMTHRVRNRLHVAALALHLVQRHLEEGMAQDAENILKMALNEFGALEKELAGGGTAGDSPSQRILRHALLVEDDANESQLLAGFLRMSGFRVDTANDGCDALDYLSSHQRPDVVLLDMHMPRCGGAETISAIRRDPTLRDLKVFAVSGVSRDEANVPIGPQGVDRWFSKPIDPQRLVEEINRYTAPSARAESRGR